MGSSVVDITVMADKGPWDLVDITVMADKGPWDLV